MDVDAEMESGYGVTELCFWANAKAEIYPDSDYRFHVISLDTPNQLACDVAPLTQRAFFGLRVARARPLVRLTPSSPPRGGGRGAR